MGAIQILRDEYPGDNAWDRFVAVFRPSWESRTDKEFYLRHLKSEDVAVVLAGDMGNRAIEWFSSPAQALENRSPRDVLESEQFGLLILRSLLMRMPR
jgi:uncharacterized protein (DUF2384 family)